ncbi:hypothetical protein [Streptomyces sp. NPDC020917]|uniref:hypothetical protein n=1 Tax=Streptomyces sp. NPDC020917 TaxID=3365102 RepID=UPI00378D9768
MRSSSMPRSPRKTRSGRVRTLVTATGTALLFASGPALADTASGSDGPVVDVMCKGNAAARLDNALSPDPQTIHWSVNGVLSDCNNGQDRPARTGDGAWHEVGQETASCTSSDIASARYTQRIMWADGQTSLIVGHLAIDDHSAGESLTKAIGTVVSGAYEGDTVLESSTVMTTHPGSCQEAGRDLEEAVGTFVFSH